MQCLEAALSVLGGILPPDARAKKWFQEGRIGDLLLINMTMWIVKPNDSSPWFRLRASAPALPGHHVLLLR